MYVAVVSDNGTRVQDTLLFGESVHPSVIEVGGKTWAFMLRHPVHSMTFKLKLEKFIKDDHPGMAMARAYSSDVIRTDADGSEHKLRIEMNEPLRKDGFIIYQSGFGPQNGEGGPPYTVLAVSVNPSDRIPWLSVAIIALGLTWTFVARLFGFLGKQKRMAAKMSKASGSNSQGKAAA